MVGSGRYSASAAWSVWSSAAERVILNYQPAIEANWLALSASSFTRAVPEFMIPISFAALLDKSMILPLINGPRSLMRTMTSFPFRRLVTLTKVPKGSDG